MSPDKGNNFMVHINAGAGEIGVKIVYCSVIPGGGRQTLDSLKEALPEGHTGDVVSIATESGRTLFFDFLTVFLGTVGNYKVNLKLYAAPEASYYEAPRRLVVDGADGIIFIADSFVSKQEQNKQMLEFLIEYVSKESDTIPLVFQYNYMGKESPESRITPEELDQTLNSSNQPSFSINESKTVLEPLKEVVKLVFAKMS